MVLATAPDGPPVIVVSGAIVSTVHVRVAGVASVLPGRVGRAHAEGVCALGQPRVADRARPERRPVEAALERRPASVEENVNVAEVLATVPDGPAVIVVSGATVSTVHVRVAGVASVFPAASVARTRKVCEPWARPV